MLALYHDWDSLCSFKVRMCLAEKELEWSSRRIFLGGFEHLQPGYLNLNPNGYVPTLVHDGRPIVESSMINEYLDEVFPDRPLKPSDPFLRARMRVWVKYEDDTVHPAIRKASFQLMVKQRIQGLPKREIEALVSTHPWPDAARAYISLAGTEIDYAAVRDAMQQFRAIIDRMDGALAQSPWIAANTFTLADTAMAPLIDRLEHLGMSDLWADRKRVQDWIARIKARPAYARALTPAEHRMPSPTAEMLAPLRGAAAIGA
jgi:glutathione S-transferase